MILRRLKNCLDLKSIRVTGKCAYKQKYFGEGLIKT